VLIKKLAAQGLTILCKIDQPTFEEFEALDRIYFMSLGRLVFSGDHTGLYEFFAQ
jgi:ABC-type multidrug transport system ATPase subunit